MKLWKVIQESRQSSKKEKITFETLFLTVLLCVNKRTNRLERFVLYTNLIISNFITCIYRKLTINYSKFHMKNYQACFFYKDLANSRIFSWHARWEKRLPPLPKKLAWPSMSSNPPSIPTNLLRNAFGHFDGKTPSVNSWRLFESPGLSSFPNYF